MGKVIGIISIKGGVGKTTISSSIASALVDKFGKKVLLIDANYSAPNLGLHMDIVKPDKTIHDVLAGRERVWGAIHKRFGVDVIPGSYIYNYEYNPLKLKDRLSKIKEDYDFVIIDSSPSLNEEVLSAMLASDNLFVVSTPDYPTLSCSLRAARLAKQRGKPISGIILNKIRNPKYELSLKEIESAIELPIVARIPDDSESVKSLFTRIPLSIYNRKSKFSKEVNKLCAALANQKEKRSALKNLFSFNFNKEEVNRQLLRESFYERTFSGE